MESFGIALYLLGGMLASPVFCFVLSKIRDRFPSLNRIIVPVATAALALFLIEITLVALSGIIATRALIGPPYFLLHVLLTFSAAPALACAFIFARVRIIGWWPTTAFISWIVGAAAIFYQYEVAEALYGIEGSGGPYQWPW